MAERATRMTTKNSTNKNGGRRISEKTGRLIENDKTSKKVKGVRRRYRKDGSEYWEARLTLPGGKRTQFYADTMGEADLKREEAKRRIADHKPLLDDRLTAEGWIKRWLVMQEEKIEESKLKAGLSTFLCK